LPPETVRKRGAEQRFARHGQPRRVRDEVDVEAADDRDSGEFSVVFHAM
jgi:hypothetical protein